ncbi:MAG: adenosine deaminase [bacterium]|nr:adenosine deaminase [bacterium]
MDHEPPRYVTRSRPHDDREVTRELVRNWPKTDLHCHLDGSVRPETIWELAHQQKVKLPAASPEELRTALVVGDRAQNLREYLEPFHIVNLVLQEEEALERAAYELAEDAWNEGVWYLEVRFSPILHIHKGLHLTDIMDAVIAGLQRAERSLGIRTGVIVCGIRSIEPEVSLRLAELTVAYKNRGVVAFDLAGAEDNYPAKDHVEAFYLIRKNNINCTVHAGEAWGPDSISQALHNLSTHRIGHGTRLKENGDLLNYVNDHRIPLEMCITSNVQTKVVKSFEQHPIRFYYDYGMRVTINTDNRLISGTDITEEFLRAHRYCGMTLGELEDIVIMGWKASFMPYREKTIMLQKVLKELDKHVVPY